METRRDAMEPVAITATHLNGATSFGGAFWNLGELQMTDFRLDLSWESGDEPDPDLHATAASLKITLGDQCLTENVDIWSNSPRDEVLVSTYPLAIWMVSSWWRLHHEILPVCAFRPPTDWRMCHEIGAAGHGYVWPLVMFATDREVMNVHSEPLPHHPAQSVRYLTKMARPVAIPMRSFTETCRTFIEEIVDRLNEKGRKNSELEQEWSLIMAESADPAEGRKRRIEAQFGFDPEECPEGILSELMAIEERNGEDVLAELAAVRSLWDGKGPTSIKALFELPGVDAEPKVPKLPSSAATHGPRRRAKADAAALRGMIGAASDGAVGNDLLADVLGLSRRVLEDASAGGRLPASVAGRIDDGRIRIVARKRHPVARRFEMARLVGGYVDSIERDGDPWFALTDSKTARQKYQRAFAAEFLCPIDSLASFLDGDYSESAIEDAAAEFLVSERTVSTQLANNQLHRPAILDSDAPYFMAA